MLNVLQEFHTYKANLKFWPVAALLLISSACNEGFSSNTRSGQSSSAPTQVANGDANFDNFEPIELSKEDIPAWLFSNEPTAIPIDKANPFLGVVDGLENESSFVLRAQKKLSNGGVLESYDQYVNGSRLPGAGFTVSLNRQRLINRINGTVMKPMNRLSNITRSATLSNIRKFSIDEYAGFSGVRLRENQIQNLTETESYIKLDGKLRLVKEVNFVAFTDKGVVSPTLVIDVEDGRVIEVRDEVNENGPGGNTKIGRYEYGSGSFPSLNVSSDGVNCSLDNDKFMVVDLNHGFDLTKPAHKYVCPTNNHKQINGAYSPLNDAYGYAQIVYEMYEQWYGEAPLEEKLPIYVHYGQNYSNALSFPSGLAFGDGNGVTTFPFAVLDVMAHEIAHSFTRENSGLKYKERLSDGTIHNYPAGGINEAYSDIAAEAAEHYASTVYNLDFNRSMPDLMIGSDIRVDEGGFMRDMCEPENDGNSRGHIDDWETTDDVHYSSGLFNKAYCKLIKDKAWSVKNAFDMFTVANQFYWQPETEFQDGAEGVLLAAKDLSLNEADVVYAFGEVGISLGDGEITMPPDQTNTGAYVSSKRAFFASVNSHGCRVNDVNCFTKVCKSQLNDTAWLGNYGCTSQSSDFLCMADCKAIYSIE